VVDILLACEQMLTGCAQDESRNWRRSVDFGGRGSESESEERGCFGQEKEGVEGDYVMGEVIVERSGCLGV
jgi:hypothetical protein